MKNLVYISCFILYSCIPINAMHSSASCNQDPLEQLELYDEYVQYPVACAWNGMKVAGSYFWNKGAGVFDYCYNVTLDAYLRLVLPLEVNEVLNKNKILDQLMLAIQAHDNRKVEDLVMVSIQAPKAPKAPKVSSQELIRLRPAYNESPLLCALRSMDHENFDSRICASCLVKSVGHQESRAHIEAVVPKELREQYLERLALFS